MIKYASIVVLDDSGNVITVLKDRPAWQAGFYNFPGGHVEEDETFIDAAVRELKEETNISVDLTLVNYLGEISDQSNYILEVFTTKVCSQAINDQIKTMTSEKVVKMPTEHFYREHTVRYTKDLLHAAEAGETVRFKD